MTDFDLIKQELLQRVKQSDSPREVLKSAELKKLYSSINLQPSEQKAQFGRRVNDLKTQIERAVDIRLAELSELKLEPIDTTAPQDINAPAPSLLPAEQGSRHPLRQEIKTLSDVFERMGFAIEDSREIDDQFNMFDALNFAPDHPARDDYDTFLTAEVDQNNQPFVAPAHTSNMQNRLLKKYRVNLENNQPIAAVVPDRVFRNEDLDARHEHTFYQVEGIFVDKNVTVGMLIATLQTFLQEYYGKKLKVRTNPFYFPFTEPSFEFALSCPFCEQKGCKVCSFEGWIELIGCGMIHPNVLRAANIDPQIYSGFAFGCGIDRLVMMKNNIEDVRHFESAKLDFLEQF